MLQKRNGRLGNDMHDPHSRFQVLYEATQKGHKVFRLPNVSRHAFRENVLREYWVCQDNPLLTGPLFILKALHESGILSLQFLRIAFL
jgi:hypothetical protein